jgi:hypothetical protein
LLFVFVVVVVVVVVFVVDVVAVVVVVVVVVLMVVVVVGGGGGIAIVAVAVVVVDCKLHTPLSPPHGPGSAPMLHVCTLHTLVYSYTYTGAIHAPAYTCMHQCPNVIHIYIYTRVDPTIPWSGSWKRVRGLE